MSDPTAIIKTPDGLQRKCHFFGAAALTVAAARLAMIIAAATLAIASAASARQSAIHPKGYAPAAAPQTRVTVDRNDPALTGGGSLGYNQRVEQGF
jgi:hypothetical protein